MIKVKRAMLRHALRSCAFEVEDGIKRSDHKDAYSRALRGTNGGEKYIAVM